MMGTKPSFFATISQTKNHKNTPPKIKNPLQAPPQNSHTNRTNTYVPWSKVAMLGMVIQPFNRNPYNGYINPYYWVDEFIPYYMEMSWELIDPIAHVHFPFFLLLSSSTTVFTSSFCGVWSFLGWIPWCPNITFQTAGSRVIYPGPPKDMGPPLW